MADNEDPFGPPPPEDQDEHVLDWANHLISGGEDLVARMQEFDTFGDGLATFDGEEPNPASEEVDLEDDLAFEPIIVGVNDIDPADAEPAHDFNYVDMFKDVDPDDIKVPEPVRYDRSVNLAARKKAATGRMSFHKAVRDRKNKASDRMPEPDPFDLTTVDDQDEHVLDWANHLISGGDEPEPADTPKQLPWEEILGVPQPVDSEWFKQDPPDPRTGQDPLGQNNDTLVNAVDAASDAVDQTTQSIVELLQMMATKLRNHQYDITQIKDKLEVEDMRDEY